MNKKIFFLGFILLCFFFVGCSDGEKKLVEITPEEWGEIAEAEEYCRALDYFDAVDSISECQKDQLSYGLRKRYEEYFSTEQQQLRKETREAEEARRKEEAEAKEKAELDSAIAEIGITEEEAIAILNKIAQDAPLDDCQEGTDYQAQCLIAAWELAFRKGIPEGYGVICGLIKREELKPICDSGVSKDLQQLEEYFEDAKAGKIVRNVWS